MRARDSVHDLQSLLLEKRFLSCCGKLVAYRTTHGICFGEFVSRNKCWRPTRRTLSGFPFGTFWGGVVCVFASVWMRLECYAPRYCSVDVSERD